MPSTATVFFSECFITVPYPLHVSVPTGHFDFLFWRLLPPVCNLLRILPCHGNPLFMLYILLLFYLFIFLPGLLLMNLFILICFIMFSIFLIIFNLVDIKKLLVNVVKL
jgi:hypothetical protein